jgi:hypothetical protein
MRKRDGRYTRCREKTQGKKIEKYIPYSNEGKNEEETLYKLFKTSIAFISNES